jgi:di/tricarboxylate transporter
MMTVLSLASDPRALTLAVGLVTLGLFLWNRLRVDVVALLAMIALMALGVVTPAQGISGFANEAVITVAAMLALSVGLLRTGAIDDLGRWMGRVAGGSEFRLLCLLMAVVVPLSALINNTAAVAVLLPMVLGVARSMDAAPSRLLMPLSFAGQMGGTLTLVGTSTNLLVAGLVLDLGMDRIGIFDITAPAAILTLVGVAWLLTVGRWMTPVRKAGEDLVDAYELRAYLAAFRVLEASPLVDRTLAESQLGEREGILVVGIRREGRAIRGIGGATRILPGDELLVEGSVTDVARFVETEGLEAIPDEPDWEFPPGRRHGGEVDLPGDARSAGDSPDDDAAPEAPAAAGHEARSDDPDPDRGADADSDPDDPEDEAEEEAPERILAEFLVLPRSGPENRRLRELGLRSRWDVTVLGIQRRGRPLKTRLLNIPLRAGDVLLVEGRPESLRALHQAGELSLLGSVDVPARRRGKRALAISILLGVVALPALGVAPIVLTSVAGVMAMFLTGCLTPDEAYQDMDWMVLILLGAIIPLGIAMQETGTAELLVSLAVGPMEALGPVAVLGAFYLLTALLTEAISNNAAAVVMTPLAVAAGAALGVSPLPLVVAVMFAASNSFLTPIGYQTNTFIYGPGGYRFTDFLRVGGPLSLLLLVVAVLVLPRFFPF